MNNSKLFAFKSKIKRRAIAILGLLVFTLGYGTIGFMTIENVSVFDSFYMAVITMTTVGFAEVIPLSDAGRLFTVTTIFIGLLCSGLSLGLVTNLIFEETLLDVFKGRQMLRQTKRLRDHFIVCGFGTTGHSIVEELLSHGEKVVVIDHNPLTENFGKNTYFLEGDARQDDILIQANIKNAKGLASTLTEDADNVFVTLGARALNENLKIVSRYKEDPTEKKLITAGADHAVSPYRMGGQRLALSLTNPHFTDVLDATFKGSSLDVQFTHLHVPPNSPIEGRTIGESNIRKHSLGALVVAVIDHKHETIFNPTSEFRFNHVQRLIVLGDRQQIGALKAYLLDNTHPDYQI